MKILAAGDLHGDTIAAKRLAGMAMSENVDLVILSGDITSNNQNHENLIGHFKKINKKVLIIPGNHDSFATADFLAELYDVKNIHGYGVRYDDVGIFGCGGANIGLAQLSEKNIFKYLEKAHQGIQYLNKKIMVTHVHPAETIMEKMSNIVIGSTGVTQAIKEFNPNLLICSHVHEAQGIEEMIGNTTIINVGKKGKIINI